MSDIQPYKQAFALLDPDSDLRALMDENMGEGATFGMRDVPRWTFPGSGNKQWVWNGPNGKEFRDGIEGVVLGQRTKRTFYATKYDGGGSPPDCSSDDGAMGRPRLFDDGTPDNLKIAANGSEVEFGGACKTCPLDQWETGRLFDPSYHGNGKACGEYRDLLVMEPDGVVPIIIQLPSTALRDWSDFGMTLVRARMGLSRAVLHFTIDLPKGATYGTLAVGIVGSLTKEDAASLKTFMPDLRRPALAAPTDVPLSPENEALVAASEPY